MNAARTVELECQVGERRTAPRVTAELGTIITFNIAGMQWTEVDAALVDLSRCGMFVRSDRVPSPTQDVMLRFSMPGRGDCIAVGRAVRCADGFAARFQRINPAFSKLMLDLGELSSTRAIAFLREMRDTYVDVR